VINRFRAHIESEFPFLFETKILLAISGGRDSVVLAYLLQHCNLDFSLAHVNFKLRGEASQQDEIFVRKLAQSLQVPIFVIQSDTKVYAKTHKLSIQMAAREIRYNWFEDLLENESFDYVLTGHHANDDIETFFINLSRSAGLEGLTGIPKLNQHILRPLLNFSREDITIFAKQNNITWREDESNSDTKYLRNKIRHELLPTIESVFPQFNTAFQKTQQHLQDSQTLILDYLEYIKDLFWEEREDAVYISIEQIQTIPHYEMVLYQLLKAYGFTNTKEIKDLLTTQSGKQLLSVKYRLLKDRSFLILVVIEDGTEQRQRVSLGSRFCLGENRCYKTEVETDLLRVSFDNTNQIYIDKAKVNLPFIVRKWEKGDYFYPLGMTGRKKISDFLIDLKRSLYEKENIYLLCDADGEVIWVIDYRLDSRFKLTEKSNEVVRISKIE
jgi:tRNA(Ile)-lysidine synthase